MELTPFDGHLIVHQQGVHDGAPAQLQSPGLYELAYFGKDDLAQIMTLREVAKVQQGGGVGYAFSSKVHAAKAAHQSVSYKVP